ncbi:hypothetical protein SAMN02745148_03421 [Modicisalibacter ilicicola DSM 19980]|uniref:Uncharacterized protein n=1 Tax=Modicisalibacter ilicicola DSM 19980 TaxID=1121942 RepID=A0A1M5E473_9GAMM|nr:hypothetical protein SAMN02745148_03421 [Halomonas ilicicola DSM 19980]
MLQDSLLGKPASEVLDIDALIAEMEYASRAVAVPLLRLRGETPDAGKVEQSAASLAQRMRGPLIALHAWVLVDEPSGPATVATGALEDFIHFIAMARSLAEFQSTPSPGRLMHLLGLARVRARLEAHVGLVPAIDMPLLPVEEGLNAVEIAAVCSLKLTTVRNAISRREMPYTKQEGAPLDEVLDWMVQRSGFLYPHVNAVTLDRRINGRLANSWLMHNPKVTFERCVSRLRLSLWYLQESDRRLALNAEGVRGCVLLLPAIDPVLFEDQGLEQLEDRTDDPAAAMHREALSLAPEETLWQCHVPTLRVLEALIDRLRDGDAVAPPMCCGEC